MIVDHTNIDTPETVEWFMLFQSLIRLFESSAYGIFGGVVRDYMVPCTSNLLNVYKYSSLQEMVKMYGAFEFHDFDVCVPSLDHAKSVINTISARLVPKEILPLPVISYDNSETMSINCIFAPICGKADIIFKIDLVNMNSIRKTIDFTVNNLMWTAHSGLVIMQFTDLFCEWVASTEPRIKAQGLKATEVDWTCIYIDRACIDLVCANILSRKAVFIKDTMECSVDTLVTRFAKLLDRGYTIERFEHSGISAYVSLSANPTALTCGDVDAKCIICMEPFIEELPNNECSPEHNECSPEHKECSPEQATAPKSATLIDFKNNQIISRTSCGHIYHLICLYTWLKKQQHEQHRAYCPTCRTVIKVM